MCCMLTALFFIGPRFAILVWWLINPVYVGAAFESWLLTLLAWAFIPWTVLTYLFIYARRRGWFRLGHPHLGCPSRYRFLRGWFLVQQGASAQDMWSREQ